MTSITPESIAPESDAIKLRDMFGLHTKSKMIAPERALKGRAQEMSVAKRHTVLGTPLKAPFPEGFEQIVVGMGCFWGAERVFWQAPGVYTTAVGYAGGYTPNPSYEEVCSGSTGHTEAVLVVFDPAKTSYGEMLRLFWENHDPTQGMRQGNDGGTQYRSAIYWDTDEHRRARRGLPRGLQRAPARTGIPGDHHRDRQGRPLLLRRGATISSTWTRTRGVTAAWAAPASAARSGSASPPRPTWSRPRHASLLEPTADQIERYRRDGFLIVERFLEQGALEEIRRHFMAVFEHRWETGLAPDEVNYTPGVTAADSRARCATSGRPTACWRR